MFIYKAKTKKDFEFISSLFSKENTKYYLTRRISVSQLMKLAKNPRRIDYIITVNGKKIGWFNINVSVDYKEAKFGLIIDKPFCGKGYGTLVMAKIEQEAKKLGVKKIILEVLRSNKVAINLYKKVGYRLKHDLYLMEKKVR